LAAPCTRSRLAIWANACARLWLRPCRPCCWARTRPVWASTALRNAGLALVSGNDCVLVPALDGGYVMIGLSVPAPGLFQNMPWGGPEVLAETRQRCVRLGLSLVELAACSDLDRPEDLALCPPHLLDGLPLAKRR